MLLLELPALSSPTFPSGCCSILVASCSVEHSREVDQTIKCDIKTATDIDDLEKHLLAYRGVEWHTTAYGGIQWDEVINANIETGMVG